MQEQLVIPSLLVTPRLQGPRHLVPADAFCPNAIREAKAKALAAQEKGGEEGLEAMMDRMLRLSTLPFLQKNKLFGLTSGTRGKGSRSAHENARSSVNRMRCRTVLQVYGLLDPLNIGYIDPETACECIANVRKDNEELAEVLLHVLEDMLPFVSPRGVIEKSDFLGILREWIEIDISGISIYYSLRLATNIVSTAYKNGIPCTNLADRDFYKGTYVPQGLDRTFRELQEEKISSWPAALKGQHPEPRPHSGPAVEGDLMCHIDNTAKRREMKTAAIKNQMKSKEMEECSFKPQTTKMPTFRPLFPTHQDFMNQEEKVEKKKSDFIIERDIIELDREIAKPPIDAPTPFEDSKKGAENSNNAQADKKKEKLERDKKQTDPDRISKEEMRSEIMPALKNAETFDVWILHNGKPEVRPMEFDECLRAMPLPPVPLDGLSPDPPTWPVAKRRGLAREEGVCTPERGGGAAYAHLSGDTPYTLKNAEDIFPQLKKWQQDKQKAKSYKPQQTPLTPGLPTEFSRTFVGRHRVRESSAERRMRLGQAKATQLAPGIAEAAAEMRVMKKKLLGAPNGALSDPLLWDAKPTDFCGGLARPAKKQPPSFYVYSRR